MEASRATPELRPLSLGEILDAAFKLYKAHFKTLCLCVLVVVVPITIFTVLLQASALENAFDPTPPESQETGSTAALIAFAISILALVLLVVVATAACVRAVTSAYLGEGGTSWQESLRFGFRKLAPLLVATVLTFLAVLAGFIALIIPAIYVFIRLAVVTPALLVEDIGAPAALRRSWALVKDRWWVTFGVVVVSTLLIQIIGGLLQLVLIAPLFADSSNEVLGAVLTGLGQIVGQTFTVPLQAAVVTILYFDLRVRKEGFDLQLRSRDVGEAQGGGTDSVPGSTVPGGTDDVAGRTVPGGTDDVARRIGLGADEPERGGTPAPGPGESTPRPSSGDPRPPTPEERDRP